MQHGRGATRDYCPPNKFPLHSTKICVWGVKDRDRLLSQGIEPNRIRVTGSPVLAKLRPRKDNLERNNVLFVPIITDKEEPENLLVFNALRKIEVEEQERFLIGDQERLKKGWGMVVVHNTPDGQRELRREIIQQINRDILAKRFRVFAKLTSIHDRQHYICEALTTNQGDANAIDEIVEMLLNMDCVVCLEDGTLPLLAHALNIPVVLADVFKWVNYGGTDYSKVEIIKSSACYRVTKMENIGKAVKYALQNRNEKRLERQKVVEEEGGIHLGNPVENIIGVINECLNQRITIARA